MVVARTALQVTFLAALLQTAAVNAAEPPPPRSGLGVASVKAAYTETASGMEFVTVPAGCFIMGDTHGDGQGDEKPLHEVCLDSFLMGKYEVTNGQYRKFRATHSSGNYEGNNLNDDNQPVTAITWYEAAEYADWLSRISGRRFRLPTEAEWEYAARGGTEGRNYWGDDPETACNNANGADQTAKKQWPDWMSTDCNDGYKVSAPVGRFHSNRYGIHDIMGNTWEWTNDWYDAEYYTESPKANPPGPGKGKLKIPRGGGWLNASECVRVADRNGFAPDFSILFLGFRLVSSDLHTVDK